MILALSLLLGGFLLIAGARGQVQSEPPVPPMVGDLLSGRTIIIDPGHGGWDPGARGRYTTEAIVNLAVALKLKAWLRTAGARVLMTWDSPQDIPPDRKYRVRERLEWINRQHADVLIDIHCNSGQASFRNPQTFYWDGAPSYHLAHDVQEELRYFTHSRRDVKRIDQYVLRYAHMPAINVEIGYLTNAQEERLLMTSSYQEKLTWYIFVGIERWLLKGRWSADLLDAPPPTDLLVR
ncbi:MAG: N-acetylmuramoyl-L-alanine amidase [Sulfobacillus acidophilus]|uniref:N-acetylmuramoyl-L-alanine amidase n=1 Tax=Sulfobacillus acidophilus TaxID=53633 RepID=A0A2T2WI50_9FIRM|nr:MAG: N-acetylmuramoyl-L-alanine amidase [Sulfobacillus acidophilus]